MTMWGGSSRKNIANADRTEGKIDPTVEHELQRYDPEPDKPLEPLPVEKPLNVEVFTIDLQLKVNSFKESWDAAVQAAKDLRESARKVDEATEAFRAASDAAVKAEHYKRECYQEFITFAQKAEDRTDPLQNAPTTQGWR